MLETVLLSLAWGFGLLLLVPLVIAAEVERPRDAGQIEVQVDGRMLGGLVGVRLQAGAHGWRMYPLLLFLVPVPFLSMALAREKPTKTGPVRGGQRPREESGEKEDEDNGGKADAGGGRGTAQRAAGLLRFPSLILAPGLQLLRALAGALGLVRLRISGRLGLGDPSLTGGAYGLLEGLGGALRTRGALGESGSLQIEVTPEFRRKEATGRVDLTLHLYLGYLLAIVLRFAVRVAWRWTVLRLSALLRLPSFSAT